MSAWDQPATETVAAIIVEPMSISAAGFVVPHDAYYRRLREICDKHHVLLIYDEIITGFGRLGEWFGANFYGVAPDLLCVGKGMGGGYVPISAVIVAGQVWEAFLGDPAERREFHHGHTFAGNPVASAAGCAAIDEMEARDLPGNAKAQGAYVRSRLQALQREVSHRQPCLGRHHVLPSGGHLQKHILLLRVNLEQTDLRQRFGFINAR